MQIASLFSQRYIWYGYTLKYASPKLRADRGVVKESVCHIGYALEYALKELRADREIVLHALRDAHALQYASKELRADREIILAAVSAAFSGNGCALKHAAQKLQADREIVLAAVRNWASRWNMPPESFAPTERSCSQQ